MVIPLLVAAGAMAAASAAASYYGTRSTNSANARINASQLAAQDRYAAETRDFNAAEALKTRIWETHMSNTAYQRSMRDMRAAGLNPILAYQQGGASTPAAPSASVSTPSAPSMHRMENALGPAVSSAMQAAQTIVSLQQGAAQLDQTQAQTLLTAAETERARSATALNTAQAVTESERAGLVSAQRATELVTPSLRNAQTAAASAQAALAGEQQRTEQERQPLTRAQTGETIERANYTRTQDQQRRLYGPPGVVSSTVGGVSQTVDSIRQSLRDALGPRLR